MEAEKTLENNAAVTHEHKQRIVKVRNSLEKVKVKIKSARRMQTIDADKEMAHYIALTGTRRQTLLS